MKTLKRWWYVVLLLALLALGLRLYLLLDATPAYASLATSLGFAAPEATPLPAQPTATATAKPTGYYEGPVNCHADPPMPDTSGAKQQYADYLTGTIAPNYHLEAAVLLWQVHQESGFNPNAVSSAGAIGIAQFMPATAKAYGINPWEPYQSLDAMARYDLASLQSFWGWSGTIADQFGGNRNSYAWGLALAAYNAGGGAVGNAVGWASRNSWYRGPWTWLYWFGDANQTFYYVPDILGCLATS